MRQCRTLGFCFAKQGGQAAGTGSYEIAYATRIICFANKEDKSSAPAGAVAFASQNKEDYMAKNSKKIIALTAAAGAVGAVAATLAACFTKYRKNKNADKTADEITADNENDDIDTIDFESLTNDTPREYVSISINTHKEKE